MTFVRYGQAALIAAIMAMMGNVVWAQQPAPASSYLPYSFCKDGKCCKDGNGCCDSKKCAAKCACGKDAQCCKAGDCCNSKKCDAKCTCSKDSKCACCKDGECCCDNNGKCSCGKDKFNSTTIGFRCCPFMNTLAKRTAIIVVMPASMPLPACCMEMMGMMPHPLMPPMPPPGPHAFLPPMMPPMPPIPPTPSMGIGMPVMPPMPTVCAPCPDGNTVWAAGPPSVVQCSTTPTDHAKDCIIAAASSGHDELAMSIGDETSIRCKKMTITIGENEIRVSRFDDRVRVRGEELKATADCVRTHGKDRIILEGDVVLSYRKEGSSVAKVLKADHIELNLSNGAVTMKRSRSIGITPVIHESK